VEQGAWKVRFGETPKTRREARVLPGVDWQCVFRRGRCCGLRGVRISHTTAVINAVGRALSKRLEREKARMKLTTSDKNNAMNLPLLLADFTNPSWYAIAWTIALIVLLFCLPRLLGIVYIPHTHVGVIEKIWSGKGSLKEGQIIARNGEAGFQARFLRGGIHFGLYPWQYRIHKEPLVVVGEGKMA
jgi:hypothetical protein